MPDCTTQGDGDLYGLGVRLGLYLQWAAGLLLRNCNGSWETISTVRIANNVLCFSLILTLVVYTAEGSTLSTDYLIVYYLTIALFYSESYNLLEKSESPSSTSRSYVLRPDVPILAQNLLFAFTSFFGAWFWLRGIHEAPEPACPAQAALFGVFELQDPTWRAFAATMGIMTGLIFAFFFAAHGVELVAGSEKGPVARAFGTAGVVVAEALFAGSGSGYTIKKPNANLRSLLRPRLASLWDPRTYVEQHWVGMLVKVVHWVLINLAGPLVAIVSAERMLRANQLETPGIAESSGQMIALITGISSTCVALTQVVKGVWGEADGVEDVVLRDVYRSSQVKGKSMEKSSGSGSLPDSDLDFLDVFATEREQYPPRSLRTYKPKVPKSLQTANIVPTPPKDTRLINAVKQNQDKLAENLLSEGIDPNTRDQEGRTALHWAVIQSQMSTVQILCAHSETEVNCRDLQYGRTPLAWAAALGKIAIVKYLLSKNSIDINSEDRYRQTPLTEAVRENHTTIVELLLSAKAVKADHLDREKRTPLFWAAKNGNEAMARLLIAENADPNIQDRLGHTPLFWAARSGQTRMAELLIKLGSKTDHRDICDQTSLFWAARNGHADCVKYLLRHAADPNDVDKYNRTPLIWASMYGHVAVVDVLLGQSGVDRDIKDMDGRTPLIWAGICGHEAVIRRLTEETGSAGLQTRDEYGQTALSMAMQNEHQEAVYALLQPLSYLRL